MLREHGYLSGTSLLETWQKVANINKEESCRMKLNKKVLASVIAAGILTTGTALANPFDDVPKGHWAYDAVQSLADQGIVDGFGDGTYRGDKLMTRYEMAQIVARAISVNKGNANPTLDKLSAEYADELSSLGVKVDNLEKSTAGVKDLKISHWFQSENTYGESYGGDVHEYEIEYRLTAEKQISEKLGMLMQMETKTFWDDVSRAGGADNVYTRLAYLTYKPDADTTVIAGKNAYWLAGGLLMDDYIEGINFTTKLGEKTSLQLMHGRYDANKKNNQINYAGLESTFGVVNVGAHYMTGQEGAYRDTGNDVKIWALTAAADIGAGLNLSLGYAENTGEDDDNTLSKVQLYKKLGKVDTFLQYWKEEGNYNPAAENGNHLAWWGDQYFGAGVEGFRLILGYPVSPNCYAEAWYGDYESTADGVDSDGKKYGWALTFSY